ncbi:L,D-transpeptidase [Hyphomicrobium zavarzinii]|uniref:L,D-transpeptidase n=1 Tax=Hyphomicrobium zavarzinii TaxID=48292 RepID=UPI002353C462|nr:L,D-transpeptidase family protein [Hyphomicrobium zavarzinii]
MPQFSGTPLYPFALWLRPRAVSTLALLMAGAVLAAPHAEAQGLFGNWDSPPVKVRKVKRPPPAVTEEVGEKSKGKKSKSESVAEKPATGPLVISVSLARQRLAVYDSTGRIAESPISSGRVGYSTPTGVFTVLEKNRVHHSNLYSGAPMPNMQRLTWSGVALHAGVLPGYPASHGCIRLPHGFSKKLFGMTKLGTRVIVTRDPVSPAAFSHDRLFTALPPEDAVVTGSTSAHETQVADASRVTNEAGGVSAVLGVSAAAAAGTDGGVAPARLSLRERRQLEAEQLAAEIRTVGYEKVDKAAKLEALQKEAAVARQPLIAARAEAEQLGDELSKLEKGKAGAERELAMLQKPEDEDTGKKKRKNKKVMDKAKREARIAELTEELAELPPELEAKRTAWQAADAAFKKAEETAKAADDKRRAAAKELLEVNARLSQALAKEKAAKRREAKRQLPVSVFVSRSKQRIYVRQGYEDIFNAEVTFDRPDEPVGTHVFTALDYTENKTTMTWNVVSVPHDPSRASSKKKDKTGKAKQAEPAVQVSKAAQTPQAALDRLTISDDVREQIADVMKPGSSLVISDLGIGNETGEFTDFIVPIR